MTPFRQVYWTYRRDHLDAPRFALLILILLAALTYRAVNLADTPPPVATKDEINFVWTGLSLMDTGRPVSWSHLPV